MKKILTLFLLLGSLTFGWIQVRESTWVWGVLVASTDDLSVAFQQRRSGFQVVGEGVVSRLLSDDNEGRRHQRFLLTLSSGQTLLIAHNIDLAPRLRMVRIGDTVAFNGVYEWNEKGGVVHWTHQDPRGRHVPGWLKHRGQVFQ